MRNKKLIRIIENPATWIEVDKEFEPTSEWIKEQQEKYKLKYPKLDTEGHRTSNPRNFNGISEVHLPYSIASRLHI